MHSWRVLILPYLGLDDLYKMYRFSEPWDGPNNKKLACAMPLYSCPSNGRSWMTSPFETSYVALVGPKGEWPSEKATTNAVDGSPSSTIIVVEAANSGIPWMEPRDLSVDALGTAGAESPALAPSSRHGPRTNFFWTYDHCSEVYAVMADGSVRCLPPGTLSTKAPQIRPNWPNIAALAVWLISVGTLLTVRGAGQEAVVGSAGAAASEVRDRPATPLRRPSGRVLGPPLARYIGAYGRIKSTTPMGLNLLTARNELNFLGRDFCDYMWADESVVPFPFAIDLDLFRLPDKTFITVFFGVLRHAGLQVGFTRYERRMILRSGPFRLGRPRWKGGNAKRPSVQREDGRGRRHVRIGGRTIELGKCHAAAVAVVDTEVEGVLKRRVAKPVAPTLQKRQKFLSLCIAFCQWPRHIIRRGAIQFGYMARIPIADADCELCIRHFPGGDSLAAVTSFKFRARCLRKARTP